MKIKNHAADQFDCTGLSPNMEDYLEKIAMLAEANRFVRVKDIAKTLKIKMPSVTAAIKKLGEMGLIDYEKYGHVELTEEGKATAARVWRKHVCLEKFFSMFLNLDPESAEREACKIEHHLEAETFERIKLFINFYEEESKNKADWITRIEKKISTKK